MVAYTCCPTISIRIATCASAIRSIRNNEAKGNGGGAFVGSAATTTFKDVVVEDNESTEGLGGGACVTHSVNDADCRLDVLDSTFRANNAADNDGGGLYVLQMSNGESR